MGKSHSRLIDCCIYSNPYDPHSDTSTQDSIDDTFELPRRMPRHQTPNARPVNTSYNSHQLHQLGHSPSARATNGPDQLNKPRPIIKSGTMGDGPVATSTPQRNQFPDQHPGFKKQHAHGQSELGESRTDTGRREGSSLDTKHSFTPWNTINEHHTSTRHRSHLPGDHRRVLRRRSRLNTGPYTSGGVYSESELGLPDGEYTYSAHMYQLGPSRSAVGIAGERGSGVEEFREPSFQSQAGGSDIGDNSIVIPENAKNYEEMRRIECERRRA
ncbi:hypothetical protein ABW21_db0207083 [Orbilia brochopaga]|nr:hypothetical protein ABW21_db0207083 [Drechslerella brochopaga]